MPCEHYKNALIEVAASGGVPSGELHAHLNWCASCRTAFDEEQSLFAAIDSGLHSEANTEVPPSLIPRVRARLDEVVVPRFLLGQSLVLASASVALAFIVFLLARPHHALPERVAKRVPAVVPAPTAPAPKTNPENKSPQGTQVAAIRVNHSDTSRNPTNRDSAASGNSEVLVPPGTEAAFLVSLPGLLKDLKPSQQWQEQGKALEIKPLMIEEISSAPLSSDESDPNPNGGMGQLRPLPMPAGFFQAQRQEMVLSNLAG